MEENARNIAYSCVMNCPECFDDDQNKQENMIQQCVFSLIEAWKSENIPFQDPLQVYADLDANISQDTNSKSVEQEKRHATKEDNWLAIEAEFLNISMKHHPEWGYDRIAQEMVKVTGRTRTRQQIHLRWTRVQNPDLNKGRWSKQEELELQRLFFKCNGDVKQISLQMKGRNIVQINQRIKIMNLKQ